MSNTQLLSIDPIRTLGFASLAATYNALGTKFLNPTRLICLTNTTDGDVYFSDDGVLDKLIVPAGSFKLFDITANKLRIDETFCLPTNTQFYVRYITVPTKGSVYLECMWGSR